jgi:hypothetical protein
MRKNKSKIDPIPQRFKDENAAAEFWNTHSVADYWDEMEEAHFEIEIDEMPKAVALEYPIARQLTELSRQKNKPVDELVNLLLKEWLAQRQAAKALG